jgi:hypothetical protein
MVRLAVRKTTRVVDERTSRVSGVVSEESRVRIINNLFGLTRQDLPSSQLPEVNLRITSQLKGTAGKDWLYGFLSRHKNTLSLRSPKWVSFARAKGFNRTSANNLFDLLESEVEKPTF